MKYKKIDNPGLGICHILCENKKGYLIYSEQNNAHFIVSLEIVNNRFYFNEYFVNINEAINYFNKLEKEKF